MVSIVSMITEGYELHFVAVLCQRSFFKSQASTHRTSNVRLHNIINYKTLLTIYHVYISYCYSYFTVYLLTDILLYFRKYVST